MVTRWKAPKHGDDSRYIHVRLRPPSQFTSMKTANIGNGLKQIYGKSKTTKEWRSQNVMIPKSSVVCKGNGLVIKTAKIKNRLIKMGIKPSLIKRMKTGGSADYTHPAPKR
jgi:hypothetical protein